MKKSLCSPGFTVILLAHGNKTYFFSMGSGRGRHPRRYYCAAPTPQQAKMYYREWYGGELYYQSELFPRINSLTLFNNTNPLEIDIGCATGDYIISHAQVRPHVNFIGIDRSQKPLHTAVAKSVALGLPNIKFIRADIRLLLQLFDSSSIQRAYFHFPIPVLSRKEKRNLVFTKAFLCDISRTIAHTGIISIMTDVKEYYAVLHSLCAADSRFSVSEDPTHCQTCDPDDHSFYHALWLQKGKQIFRCIAIKNDLSPSI